MASAVKYRDLVREIALGEYGFITTQQAVAAGVPAVELRKLAGRGALINVAYGIYRVPDAPESPFDQFAEALLRTGDGAYLRGDSVLALFGLADVNPRKVRVVAPKRTRAKFPAFMTVTPPPREAPNLTRYEGLLAMRVADAILDCRGRIEPTRLREAARDARKEGLVTRAEYAKLRLELEAGAVESGPAADTHAYTEAMSLSASEFYEAGMNLPPSVRKDVALRLLESLEVSDDDSVDQAWTAEIGSRVDDLLSGNVQAIPGEEVLARIDARLAEREAARNA
ncbi:addiction module protein [Nocardioides carbamazepini]|uniref:addiction module protein n=1 Tax=Nocardioides carbamazepini TaxID=2854259 RepID=UPI002149C41A|nr:addiction module protein [Nocardioides carbamazepini]MCR1781902.1 addiction module protein [Nocardioides carbamazepini]